MQRYGFATKWASMLLGMGAIIFIVGIIVSFDEALFLHPITHPTPATPAINFLQDYETVKFSLFFYGGLFIAIGTSILVFLHLRKQRNEVFAKNPFD